MGIGVFVVLYWVVFYGVIKLFNVFIIFICMVIIFFFMFFIEFVVMW